MGKVVAMYPERCLGCRLCEMICSLENEGVCSTELSRVKVNFDLFTAKADITIENCIGCKSCMRWCQAGVFRYKENSDE